MMKAAKERETSWNKKVQSVHKSIHFDKNNGMQE